jgi:drug/metabolite transporter superfamily protein YnfA
MPPVTRFLVIGLTVIAEGFGCLLAVKVVFGNASRWLLLPVMISLALGVWALNSVSVSPRAPAYGSAR